MPPESHDPQGTSAAGDPAASASAAEPAASAAGDPAGAPRDKAGAQQEEALGRNTRYLEEVVVAFNLCPWAEKSWRDGHVTRRVCLDEVVTTETVLAFVDALEAEPEVEIGLLIMPRVTLAPQALDRWAEAVRQADRARRPPGRLPDFVTAAFHPAPTAPEVIKNAWQMIPLVRRAPDPTLQLVRVALLTEVRRQHRDISDEIATRNAETLRRDGPRIEAILAEIRADRPRSR